MGVIFAALNPSKGAPRKARVHSCRTWGGIVREFEVDREAIQSALFPSPTVQQNQELKIVCTAKVRRFVQSEP